MITSTGKETTSRIETMKTMKHLLSGRNMGRKVFMAIKNAPKDSEVDLVQSLPFEVAGAYLKYQGYLK